MQGHFSPTVGNLGLAATGGVFASDTVSLVIVGVVSSMRGASSDSSIMVEITASSMGVVAWRGGSSTGRSSVRPSSNGLLGGVHRVGKGLPGVESLVSISSSNYKVSPMVGMVGEGGGVLTTGTGHLEFSLSMNSDTSGVEGIAGVKSLQTAGSSSPLEGTLFWEGNFPIFTLSLEQ